VDARLRDAAPQPSDRRAKRTVDLQRQQIVTPHAHAPRAVEVSDDAALKLQRGVCRVLCGGLVLPVCFVPALAEMDRSKASDGLYFAEQVVEHVAPVEQHVEDNSAAFFPAVIPGRALCRLQIAFEYPVAEFAAN